MHNRESRTQTADASHVAGNTPSHDVRADTTQLGLAYRLPDPTRNNGDLQNDHFGLVRQVRRNAAIWKIGADGVSQIFLKNLFGGRRSRCRSNPAGVNLSLGAPPVIGV